MLENLWNNWFLIAFIAPIFWALVNLIDIYFVAEVYDNEYDGAVVIGLTQIVPWLTVPFLGLVFPAKEFIFIAMSGGFFLVVSYFFYFKALFRDGDAALIQIIQNTFAVVVPILAFALLQEKLSLMQYGGIAITFIGVTTLAGGGKMKNEKFWPIASIMSGSVIFFSLNIIFTRELYTLSVPFYSVILFYSLGGVMGGLFFYMLKILRHGAGNLFNIGRQYIGWFIFSELVVLGGVMTSQRAIETSPAVSLVSMIESLQPAFIVVLSALIFFAFRFFSHKYEDLAKQIYNDQLSGLTHKIVAIVIMAFGVYLINL